MSAAPGRPALDRDQILEAVFEVGLDRFSMHAVARQLGVSTTALYRYFPSRDALLDAAADFFCAQLDRPARDTPWQDYMRQLAHTFRDALRRIPGAAAFGTAIGPATPAAFEVVDEALQVLRDGGFEPVEAWRAYVLVVDSAFRAVEAEERSAAKVEAEGPGGYRIYRMSEEEARRFPELTRVLGALRSDLDADYATHLEWILDGIAKHHAGSR